MVNDNCTCGGSRTHLSLFTAPTKGVQQEQSPINSAGGLENTGKVQVLGWRIQTPVHTWDARGIGGIYRCRVSALGRSVQEPLSSGRWSQLLTHEETLGGEGRTEPKHGRKEMGLLLSRRRPQAAPSFSTIAPPPPPGSLSQGHNVRNKYRNVHSNTC